jgi:transcriptional regulator with XRE-family HTH domain
MTQLELGNTISYSDKAISKWERAEAIPDAYVLLKLSELFSVSVDYLLSDHEGQLPPKVKRRRTNYASISALSIIAVWMAFAIAFITAQLAADFVYPMFFMYAAIISLILLIVFNSLWGKRAYNFIIVSALVISIIVTVYLILLSAGVGNFWQINCLCIPAELIVICCFRIRTLPKLFKQSEEASNDNLGE